MTREIAKAALDVLPDAETLDVVQALKFLKSCATFARVPHAERWQLGYMRDGICPWRIIDREARPGEDGTSNVAFTFASATIGGLLTEMQAYAKAFRGLKEILKTGYSRDLMAPSRR